MSSKINSSVYIIYHYNNIKINQEMMFQLLANFIILSIGLFGLVY